MDRQFDLVLFGASGFVGALTAAQLARTAPAGFRIGLAGRSLTRLADLRGGLGEAAGDWELIEVDAMDREGQLRLSSRTRVLASTVGPYARYGREVVRAAAEQGTHYADLTGEVLFVRWTLDEVDARARETGARIVHSCGFDSIPSDLGVLITAERAAAEGEGTLEDSLLVVRSMKGGISGGTIDSFRNQVVTAGREPAARRVLKDAYSLTPHRPEEPGVPPHDRSGGPAPGASVTVGRDAGTRHWLGPFVMADYNTRVVRLSNNLTRWSYGRGLRYREASDFGSGVTAPVRAAGMALGLAAVGAGLSWAPTRALLDRVLPRPGEGPSLEQRGEGRFRMELSSTTTSGARYRTTVAADQDPGYGGTAIMLAESALCLAVDGERLPARCGILTPATAMGDVLVDRLRAQGFTFEVSRDPRRSRTR